MRRNAPGARFAIAAVASRAPARWTRGVSIHNHYRLLSKDRMTTKYLISFPAKAMEVPARDLAAVGEAAREVIREAKAAGVYVFGGGIDTDVAPLLVASDGTVTDETYAQTKEFDGGFCILQLPSRDATLLWAAKLARACRCSQELREFGYDPES